MDEVPSHSEPINETKEIFYNVLESSYRKNNAPHAQDGKGKWEGNVYVLDDDYVPKTANPHQMTVRQMKEMLKEEYGISFTGIPFQNSEACFDEVSLIQMNLGEIMNHYRSEQLKSENLDTAEIVLSDAELSEQLFTKERRNANFDLADRTASAQHLEIAGLGSDYSASELKKWREEKGFTWHESLTNYSLVPSMIHGSIAHSGLVSVQQSYQKSSDQ